MDLSIQKLTKAFNQQSVFQNLTFTIDAGSRFAITGPNGSGKSTLLKILSGGMLPSSGTIEYTFSGKTISPDALYHHVHFVAPYNTVIEELTLVELFGLHSDLGLLRSYNSFDQWAAKLDYDFNPEHHIKTFSSGMKQRVKLGLALLDDRPLILLDEPGSNLDIAGKKWLTAIINDLSPNQTLVIATNDPAEITLCPKSVSVVAKSA